MKKPEFNKVSPPKQCPYTGRMYDGVRIFKKPCTCGCHTGSNMIHFLPCCDNGVIETTEYRYIDT